MRTHTGDQALAPNSGAQVLAPSRVFNSEKFSNKIIKFQDQRTRAEGLDAQQQRGD